MECGLFAGIEGGEHNAAGLVVIFNIFAIQGKLSIEMVPFDEVDSHLMPSHVLFCLTKKWVGGRGCFSQDMCI